MGRTLALVAALSALVATVAQAQKPSLELSASTSTIGVTSGGGSTTFDFELGRNTALSFGIPVAESFSVEPSLGLLFQSNSDVSLFVARVGLALPYYLQGSYGRRGVYIGPWVGLVFLNAEASGTGGSASQFSFGADVGYKLPLGDQVSLRPAFSVGYAVENDDFSDAFGVALNLGLSVFF